MYFQFLIEDQSSGALIDILMQKIAAPHKNVQYNIKSFRGIGGFIPKNTVKETKTGKLLNDLATYMRGFNRSLKGIPATIVVVLDNDDRNPLQFEEELKSVAFQNMIDIDHVFCIAIEEVEAWLLGDEQALFLAYPQAKTAVLRSYRQDSICGTWEVLADAVYTGGLEKFKRDCTSFVEVGKHKMEWSTRIGIHMDIHQNKSPSFNHFIHEVTSRIS